MNAYGRKWGLARNDSVHPRTHMGTLCGLSALAARADLCDALLTTLQPESLPGSLLSCWWISGWKVKRMVWSPPFQCPTCQESLWCYFFQSKWLRISQEAGSMAYFTILMLIFFLMRNFSLLPSAVIGASLLFFDYYLIVINNLWAAWILPHSTHFDLFL